MKVVTAGKKNQKISIYKPVIGKTASGAPITDQFELTVSCWASVITKQTTEQEAGDSQQAKIVYSIVIGWRNISPNWVILWRNQLLRVINVDDSDPVRRQKIFVAITENGINETEFLEHSVVV